MKDKKNKLAEYLQNKIKVFSEKYALDFEILNASKPYFLPEKERQIYDWCRAIDKGIL
tara:strand:+ start:407 stop:580 length:174 start_codon:yes stop_codon:yes gene_type:complete